MVLGKYCFGSGLGGGNILILDLDGGSMAIKIYRCALLHVAV